MKLERSNIEFPIWRKKVTSLSSSIALAQRRAFMCILPRKDSFSVRWWQHRALNERLLGHGTMRIRALRCSLACFVVGLIWYGPLSVGAQVIELYPKFFAARSLSATIVDPTGSPISGAVVEDMNENWGESLRSTKTDATGVFRFATVRGRKTYYFKVTMKNFRPIEFRMKVSRWHRKPLMLTMEVGV